MNHPRYTHRTIRFNVIEHSLRHTSHRRRALFMLGFQKFVPHGQDQLDLPLYGKLTVPKKIVSS